MQEVLKELLRFKLLKKLVMFLFQEWLILRMKLCLSLTVEFLLEHALVKLERWEEQLKGVRLINLGEGEKLAGLVKIEEKEED